MTEHKFTDEEVIKAIETCTKAKCWGDCEDMSCPAATHHGCRFYLRTDEDYEGVIQDEMLKDALDLINRQKAEIERLQKYNTDVAFNHYNDGIKEFADRLTNEAQTMQSLKTGAYYRAVTDGQIERIAREMTEGEGK